MTSDRTMQALCCTCGALRTCRRPRNYRRENFWLNVPVDRDWHRETGDLKCGNCREVTRHAILLPESTWRDHAEDIHKMAIGWEFKNIAPEVHRRVRERWREGFPRNPYLGHQWWVSDETKAREAGETHVLTMCKMYVPLPKRVCKPGNGVDRDVFVAPEQYGSEAEYEDPDTGLSWAWMSCPDCLRRSNAIALDEQRQALKEKLLDVAGRFSSLDAPTVQRLLAQLEGGEGCAESQS